MEQVLETKLDQTSPYQSLCDLADVKLFNAPIEISIFTSTEALSQATFNERLTAALQVLIELSSESEGSVHKVDKVFLDSLIVKIDELIAKQLDEILHDKDFQALESLWRSIDHLVEKTDFRSNIKLELLDTTKQEIIEDFEDASETTQSALYKHVYIDEYDTPGGEPFTSMISSFDFNAGAVDLALLKDISKVASSAHCPLIANVGPACFGKKNMDEVVKIEDLENYMEKAEYIKWNAFRQTEDARYIPNGNQNAGFNF